MAQAVLSLSMHDDRLDLAEIVMNRGQFRQTDACRRVRESITEKLANQVGTLSTDQIQRFVNWVLPDDPVIDKEVWQQIAKHIRQRWSDASDPQVKHSLAQPLMQILSAKTSSPEYLAFLRQQMQQGPQAHRTEYAHQLFNALLAQPWSEECEQEAFGLLPQLADAKNNHERLQIQLSGAAPFE